MSGERDDANDDFTSSIHSDPESSVLFSSGCSSRINARAPATKTVASDVPLEENHSSFIPVDTIETPGAVNSGF